ncbi:MAG TPA: DsbA family oxidoreductase [Flavipsychrobacter sp.]|nr:DsbA family oxidoreductase [Flavipsychrobacter sp.]
MEKNKIKVAVVADVVCPWCYLGEARLQQAISEVKDQYDVEVELMPFELNPDTPEKGENHKEYLAKKFGSSSRVDSAHAQMTSLGKIEGVEYNFDKVKVTSNTFKAHRLIWLAKQYDVQEQVANDLYKSYFTDGKDVNDTEVLKSIAVANGIRQEKIAPFFESNEGAAEVRQMEEDAHSAGITGVPAFIINNKYLVSGAQPVEVFKEVFEKVAPSAPVEIKADGNVCDDDSCEV